MRIPLLAAVLAVSFAGGGCKNRDKGGTISELRAPKDAQPWESGKAIAFDDSYTPTAINLQGRAPNDVTDQQLFQARLGHADIVMLVRIEQVWGRGRYQGRQDQFVEVEIGEFLLGNLPKDAPERLLVEVGGADELPGALKGEIMLLFLRWDAESEPPFHHHLMPANDELVALIKAMVKHAQDEGVLNAKGDETSAKKRGRKGKRKGKKGKGQADSPLELDEPTTNGGQFGGESGGKPGGGAGGVDPAHEPGANHDPGQPPPPTGPRPDESTGLQNLGEEPDAPVPESGE
ncbi:hypothetical protein DB30_04797 [Enhygromyxa salina]|uniref:Lipoprotein n=1 Tax=Enhygromyxa salina TaxID=215803 RepID=A0A0C2D364_9BACT|nr:hypothetical protein DB30_04797 [Enhygromyxa salina]